MIGKLKRYHNNVKYTRGLEKTFEAAQLLMSLDGAKLKNKKLHQLKFQKRWSNLRASILEFKEKHLMEDQPECHPSKKR